jgi:hypothetical protein
MNIGEGTSTSTKTTRESSRSRKPIGLLDLRKVSAIRSACVDQQRHDFSDLFQSNDADISEPFQTSNAPYGAEMFTLSPSSICKSVAKIGHQGNVGGQAPISCCARHHKNRREVASQRCRGRNHDRGSDKPGLRSQRHSEVNHDHIACNQIDHLICTLRCPSRSVAQSSASAR